MASISKTNPATKGKTLDSIQYRLGCRCNQVVTFTAIRLRGPGFKPSQGRNLKTTISASGAPQRWWRRVTRGGWG